MPVRGSNLSEPVGGGVSQGFGGRIVDPISGATMLNPNTDPTVVGQDENGNVFPTGYDMGFGDSYSRMIVGGLYNGNFQDPPPDTTQPISNDVGTGYNPLPFWRFATTTAGITAKWVADAGAASGAVLRFSCDGRGSAADTAYVETIVPIESARGAMVANVLRMMLASTSSTSASIYVYNEMQYLTSTGATVGTAVTYNDSLSSWSTLGWGKYSWPGTSTNNYAPATAVAARVRIGITGNNVVANGDIAEIAFVRGQTLIVLGDAYDSTFAPAYIYNYNQGLAIYAGTNGNLVVSNQGVYLKGGFQLSAADIAATSTQRDNWSPVGAKNPIWRLNPSANHNVSGIDASSTGTVSGDGGVLYLVNTTTFTVTLLHNSASSLANNRILCPGGVNYAIGDKRTAMLHYDNIVQKWRVMN